MLFDMQKIGDAIVGWVTPDNPSIPPAVVIETPEGKKIEFQTNAPRPDVKAAGVHHTGEVGFYIAPPHVPGLKNIENLVIRDAYTGILLYREIQAEKHISKRVLRFEMQALPHDDVEDRWDSSFQLYYNGIERLPYETMFGVLNNPAIPSIAIAGRINLMRYEHLLKQCNYHVITLLRDPIEEFAERIMLAKLASQPDLATKYRHHMSGLEGYAMIARRADLEKPDTVIEAIAQLNDRQMDELANPLTRSISCLIGEAPRSEHVEIALARLSTMHLVGIRKQYESFRSSLSELLGRDVMGPDAAETSEIVKELAHEIRDVKLVRVMNTLDTKLYNYVETAVNRALETTTIENSPSTAPSTRAGLPATRNRNLDGRENAIR